MIRLGNKGPAPFKYIVEILERSSDEQPGPLPNAVRTDGDLTAYVEAWCSNITSNEAIQVIPSQQASSLPRMTSDVNPYGAASTSVQNRQLPRGPRAMERNTTQPPSSSPKSIFTSILPSSKPTPRIQVGKIWSEATSRFRGHRLSGPNIIHPLASSEPNRRPLPSPPANSLWPGATPFVDQTDTVERHPSAAFSASNTHQPNPPVKTFQIRFWMKSIPSNGTISSPRLRSLFQLCLNPISDLAQSNNRLCPQCMDTILWRIGSRWVANTGTGNWKNMEKKGSRSSICNDILHEPKS